jgi:hypothetical protein
MRAEPNGSHVRVEYSVSFKNILIIFPESGTTIQFIVITSNEYYGGLLLDNCVFSSSAVLTIPICTKMNNINTRIKTVGLIIDGVVLEDSVMFNFEGENGMFVGDGMKVQNVRTTERTNLIHHEQSSDDELSYFGWEFTNVFFFFFFLIAIFLIISDNS